MPHFLCKLHKLRVDPRKVYHINTYTFISTLSFSYEREKSSTFPSPMNLTRAPSASALDSLTPGSDSFRVSSRAEIYPFRTLKENLT